MMLKYLHPEAKTLLETKIFGKAIKPRCFRVRLPFHSEGDIKIKDNQVMVGSYLVPKQQGMRPIALGIAPFNLSVLWSNNMAYYYALNSLYLYDRSPNLENYLLSDILKL